jgi:hypothetical protein
MLMANYITPGRVTDDEILEALFNSPSKTAAARALGIARSTLHERMKGEYIAEAWEAWRTECTAEASGSLHMNAVRAVEVLAEICTDPNTAPSVRVQAASNIIANSLRLRETEEVEERLAHLEAVFGG